MWLRLYSTIELMLRIWMFQNIFSLATMGLQFTVHFFTICWRMVLFWQICAMFQILLLISIWVNTGLCNFSKLLWNVPAIVFTSFQAFHILSLNLDDVYWFIQSTYQIPVHFATLSIEYGDRLSNIFYRLVINLCCLLRVNSLRPSDTTT